MADLLATTPFTVEEHAARMGHYRWAEQQLFEALGHWAGIAPEPEVALRLGTHCHHHAWHADLWRDRIPTRGAEHPDDLTAPANDAMVRFVAALVEPAATERTIEKLVGAYRVFVPHLVVAYRYHQQRTNEATDAPTVRTLRLALADELADWAEGELLLQSLLCTPDDVQRAAAHQARLESLLVAAGGVAGPGTLGRR